MRSTFALLVVLSTIIAGGVFAFRRMRQVPLVAPPLATKAAETTPSYPEAKQAAEAMRMTGPLADYMAKQDGGKTSSPGQEVETVTWTPTASDHVGGSVVGTTTPILNKTFAVRSAVQVAFEVPAHAASPRLRGSFQASERPGGGSDAPIELLVLSDAQYSDFVSRRSGDTTFAAEDAPAGEVNTRLPPTINDPAKYHLIFRNNARATGRKFVRAEFRMEF